MQNKNDRPRVADTTMPDDVLTELIEAVEAGRAESNARQFLETLEQIDVLEVQMNEARRLGKHETAVRLFNQRFELIEIALEMAERLALAVYGVEPEGVSDE